MDDIVDDDVLPRLSLAVDGLTDTATAKRAEFDLDGANESEPEIQPSTELPASEFDPEQLEVYGWESTFWRKVCGYLGF